MKVKLMPEYECYPIWVENKGLFDNIKPEKLPISPGLAIDIMEWSKIYEKTYNHKNPIESGFLTDIDKEFFCNRGIILKERLALELGSNYDIVFIMND